jgi:putative PIN family toxin of toxin-antitoxin system
MMLRVVLDTNILISSILGGRLGVILDQWKDGKFSLIVSEAIAHEYLDVIHRPKFKIPNDEIIAVTDLLFHQAEFVTPQESIYAIPADPTDNKFLEAALAGNIKLIVSGDNHLLQLETYQGIQIISAHEFIAQLESPADSP